MKYTFIKEDGKQQTVVIPEEVISKHKKDLGCTTKQAIELFLFDEGYIDNAEAAELTEKAKSGKFRIQNKGNRKAPTRKPDETKRSLIAFIFTDLAGDPAGLGVENVEITNPERIIAFSIGDDNYELTLSKKRKKAC